MKKILITGANSYIGTSLEKWLSRQSGKYQIDTVDMIDGSWRKKNFSSYDVVFHVAGIAHVSPDPKLEDVYNKVNRDLTIETARKSKSEGVKQFIFMSSIIVYGEGAGENGMIGPRSKPDPNEFYGKSKLQAEEGLASLSDGVFKIVVLRPPMIYGKGSRGNYPKLARAARKLPLFPDYENRRSMLHIDNLCEFLRLVIDREDSGLFFPQNREYVKTTEMVRLIAETHGREIRLTKAFNGLIRVLSKKSGMMKKIFGNLAYEQAMSAYPVDYRVRDFMESIKRTEE